MGKYSGALHLMFSQNLFSTNIVGANAPPAYKANNPAGSCNIYRNVKRKAHTTGTIKETSYRIKLQSTETLNATRHCPAKQKRVINSIKNQELQSSVTFVEEMNTINIYTKVQSTGILNRYRVTQYM